MPSSRFAQVLVLIASLCAATSLSAQYHLGSRTGAGGSASSGTEGSTGSTGGETGSTGETGSATGSGGGEAPSPTTYGPGDTDLGGGTVTLFKAIFNGGTVSNGTLVTSDNYEANSGEVTAILSGTIGLTKNTSSTFTISSASTYSGGTLISGGTLKLGAAGSIANTSSIRISAGATFDVADVSGGITLASWQSLSGGGTVLGPLTVGDGTTLSPGAGGVGALTFTDGLAFSGDATLNFDLGSISDLIAISGGLLTGPSSGAITLNFYDYSDFAAGTYVLFDFTGATLAGFDLTDFTLGAAPGGYDYSIDFNGSTLELTAYAIPEPASVALGLGAATLVAVIVRRRRPGGVQPAA